MTVQPGVSRRALTGLPPRRPVGTDPAVGRLRRDQREAPAPGEALPEPVPLRSATPTEPPDASNDSALPLYLRLTRKEARVREDQADKLAAEVRRLNQARKHRTGATGERITDNTLIRVAIDMLLDRAGELAGTTEEELRHSVSL